MLFNLGASVALSFHPLSLSSSLLLSLQFLSNVIALSYYCSIELSQMSYSLVVMLELNGILEVQYKEIMIKDKD